MTELEIKLAESLHDVLNFARFAKSKGVDPGFYQIGINKAEEALKEFKEKRNG